MESNNDIKIHMDTLMSGLNGMVKVLENTIDNSKDSMSSDEAFAIKKGIESMNIEGAVDGFNKTINDLKTKLNID